MAARRVSFLSLYGTRKLSEGYPDLEALGVAYYKEHQQQESRIESVIECLARLVDLTKEPRTVLVMGCGPNPRTIKALLGMGYDAVGVESVVGSARAAGEFLGHPERVLVGTAERIPLPSSSQRVVVMEAVLEHVDSPIASIEEASRVLMPGGVLYLSTNNRHAFGNSEFRSRFHQWFPPIVKESYVFRHLHYDPTLAHFTPRPAVNWFSFSDLCRLGRRGGFAQFYSLVDLVSPDAPYIRKSVLRRTFLQAVQQRPWLRALVLTLFGNAIVMLKRPALEASSERDVAPGA